MQSETLFVNQVSERPRQDISLFKRKSFNSSNYFNRLCMFLSTKCRPLTFVKCKVLGIFQLIDIIHDCNAGTYRIT